jgi:4-alpha-glucanotransferase
MIVYTGTHDNDTLYGWIKSLDKESKKFLCEKFDCEEGKLFNEIIKYTLSKPSKFTIFPIQDVLKLGSKFRMNVPGTVGYPNFCYRIKDFDVLKNIKFKIK